MNRLIPTLIALGLTTTPSLPAQTPATITPPLLPVTTTYRYWPVQFVQWIGAELPYSMIELDVDNTGKQPLLYVTLTDRATGKRIHYTDNDSLISAAAAMGEEAHKTTLAFEPADTDNPGSVTTVRFAMADGKPLQWRFVQGSDISEQGSGLSPLPDAKVPIFAYREQAAVAGEGTALQIGDTVSTAAAWPEISHPPQFVAFRGAESEGAHMLIFLPGKPAWSVLSAPAAISVGATWELEGQHGDRRSMRIDKVDGAHVTVTATDSLDPGVHSILEATRAGESWTIDQVRFAPVHDGERHFLALQFATPLSVTADTTPVALLAGRKAIASGAITGSGSGPDRTETLRFTSPAWLSGKTIAGGSAFAAVKPVPSLGH